MVYLFPSSFKKEKGEMWDVVQTQLINIKCVSYAMVTHTWLCRGFLGLLWLASGCPEANQFSMSSMGKCLHVPDQIWPLRTKNDQTFSKLSERRYFPINKLELLILELLCAWWFLGVICQISSLGFRAFQNAHRFLRLPVGFSDVNSCVCYKTTG